jgi:[ribosomal protein S18]-alanine N-acetyltransferase
MLQPAMLSDLTVVASWIASARDCDFWAGRRVRFPVNPASLPEEIGFREANAFSLFEGGRLIAFGQLIPKSSHRGHLATLIVSPSFRRRGYGAVLVSGLLAKACEARFERVSLYVDEANVAAIALYSKLTFRDASPPAGKPVFPASRYMEHSFAKDSIAPGAPLT